MENKGAKYHVSKAKSYYEKKDFQNAAIELQKALDIDPDNAQIHNDLGNTFQREGDIERAISEYKTSIEINPIYHEPYNNMGIAYYSLGKINEAIEKFQKTIELNPDYPDAYNNLGVYYFDVGDINNAIKMYKIAIEKKPDYAEARQNLQLANKKIKEGRSGSYKQQTMLEFNGLLLIIGGICSILLSVVENSTVTNILTALGALTLCIQRFDTINMAWGIILVIVGVFAHFPPTRQRSMFIVIGMLRVAPGLTNIIGSGNALWIILGVLQLLFGITMVSWFWTLSKRSPWRILKKPRKQGDMTHKYLKNRTERKVNQNSRFFIKCPTCRRGSLIYKGRVYYRPPVDPELPPMVSRDYHTYVCPVCRHRFMDTEGKLVNMGPLPIGEKLPGFSYLTQTLIIILLFVLIYFAEQGVLNKPITGIVIVITSIFLISKELNLRCRRK